MKINRQTEKQRVKIIALKITLFNLNGLRRNHVYPENISS